MQQTLANRGLGSARPRALPASTGRLTQRVTSLVQPRPCQRRRAPLQCSAQARSHGSRVAAGLAGAAAALSCLLLQPGDADALPAAAAATAQQQDVAWAMPAAELAAPGRLVCAPDLAAAAAPAAAELVTDAEVEAAAAGAASGGFCPDAAALEAAFVQGLGWMVEEAQEVTNFSEQNFAAVGAPSTSMWLSNSPWCLMWDAYCNVLTSRPVATKLITGMVGTFLGDMLAQGMQGLVAANASQQRSSRPSASARRSGASASAGSSSSSSDGAGFQVDLARTARLVGFSALVGTPVAFVWFSLLDQYVLPSDPTSPLAVFSKVALDQVLMAPLMTSLFFGAMAVLEGSARSPRAVADGVRAKLKPTLLANWTVWPLAHVVNFALVPPAQRILYINVVNIAWTAFMSHMASSSDDTQTAQQRPQQQQPHAPAAARPKQLQQTGR